MHSHSSRGDCLATAASRRRSSQLCSCSSASASAAVPGTAAPASAPPRAIFAYGTLRSDFSEGGDRWGVIAALAAGGYPLDDALPGTATVSGFAVYQDDGCSHPFAVRRPGAARLVGTLLSWRSDTAFAQALRRCDEIEGFDAASPSGGLYLRDVVQAVKADSAGTRVAAYIYHQRRAEPSLQRCKYFAEGDWLAMPYTDM